MARAGRSERSRGRQDHQASAAAGKASRKRRHPRSERAGNGVDRYLTSTPSITWTPRRCPRSTVQTTTSWPRRSEASRHAADVVLDAAGMRKVRRGHQCDTMDAASVPLGSSSGSGARRGRLHPLRPRGLLEETCAASTIRPRRPHPSPRWRAASESLGLRALVDPPIRPGARAGPRRSRRTRTTPQPEARAWTVAARNHGKVVDVLEHPAHHARSPSEIGQRPTVEVVHHGSGAAGNQVHRKVTGMFDGKCPAKRPGPEPRSITTLRGRTQVAIKLMTRRPVGV